MRNPVVEVADIEIQNHGTLLLVTPLNTDASKWVTANVVVEGWQWFGGGFVVEPRYVESIVHHARGDGLVVRCS